MKSVRSLAVSLVVFLGLGALVFAPGAAGSAPPARWRSFLHVPAVVDLTGPRADGSLTVAADGGLSLLRLGNRRSNKRIEPIIGVECASVPI